MLVPCLFLSYSLIRDVFPSKTVPLAVSIATAGMGLISIAAPFLTGWLIDDFGWRSIFWFFTVTLVVLGVLILVGTPESAVRLRSRIDFIGAILLGAGIAACSSPSASAPPGAGEPDPPSCTCSAAWCCSAPGWPRRARSASR
ncbi:MFS transporter [Tomitella cavernea]|uniref:MFS transporter n=1 Tax=Tomitella cavernea TaxID=1387982 RepID=A0ABP9BZF7_9ACTN